MFLPPGAISAICSYWGVKDTNPSLLIFSEERKLEQSDVYVITHRNLKSDDNRPLSCKQASIERLKKVFSKSNEGWEISFQSFLNEQIFLSNFKDRLSEGAIPKCIYTSSPPEHYLDSHNFITISEKINPTDYHESSKFNKSQALSALSWLSAFHKTYWKICSESHLQLFPQGCWWRKVLRPTVNYKSIPDVFKHLCKTLPSFSRVNTSENLALIESITENIDVIHDLCYNDRHKTLVHGDFKTSNIFFKSNGEVMVIDFQWCGIGNCASDVAYLIAGGIQFEDIEEALFLDHYYNELTNGCDINNTYSREMFEQDFDRELLAYFTTALPYLLKDLTPSICLENASKYGWLTHEYDERVTLWFTERAIQAAKNLINGGMLKE